MYIRQHIYSDLVRALWANKDEEFKHIIYTLQEWLSETDINIVRYMITEYLKANYKTVEFLHEEKEIEEHNNKITRFLGYI